MSGALSGFEFSLRENVLGDHCITTIMQHMPLVGWIRCLDLSGNSMIGEKGGLVLADCLRRSNSLIYLNVCACNLGSKGISTLAEGLLAAPQLQLLDIRANIKSGEENQATSSLSAWLESDSCASLSTLSLGDNGFPLTSFFALLPSLALASALKQLDLGGLDMNNSSNNNLPFTLCQLIADHMPQLQTLSLAGNRMPCSSTVVFATFLASNHSVLSLDLGGNQLDAYTAAAFGAALATNQTLTALSLAGYIVSETKTKRGTRQMSTVPHC